MSIQDEVRATLLKADPNLKETEIEYMDQAILLSSMILGADEDSIAHELGYELEFVRTVGSRLRNAAIWIGDDIDERHLEAWKDKENGGIAFLLDAGVAGGMMIAGEWKDGQRLYKISPAGEARVKKLITPC